LRERTTFTAKSIENKLIDADGNPAKLKKGAEVDVTIEADNKDTSSEE
jgi:thiamine pyrophosphate-dependent acetolactate synthase large subunit-like protein